MDSFNPQEILSRMRGKNDNVSQQQASNVASSVGSTTKQTQPSKVIKSPSAISLTPSQRQENLNVRLELEKEISRLQSEIQDLRVQNKQLAQDKQDVEEHFIEYKISTEKTIKNLRGKISQLSKSGDDRGAGVGKLYAFHSKSKGSHSNVPPQSFDVTGGFRDPTFSELMRRNTPDAKEFKETLRNPFHDPSKYKKTPPLDINDFHSIKVAKNSYHDQHNHVYSPPFQGNTPNNNSNLNLSQQNINVFNSFNRSQDSSNGGGGGGQFGNELFHSGYGQQSYNNSNGNNRYQDHNGILNESSESKQSQSHGHQHISAHSNKDHDHPRDNADMKKRKEKIVVDDEDDLPVVEIDLTH